MDRVVALAGGKSKTEAIRAVIKSGLIDVLITDRFTAERLVKPVGIADFNNDGDIDIAFVDRPISNPQAIKPLSNLSESSELQHFAAGPRWLFT